MTLDLPAVRKMVARGESETVELKRTTAERDPAAKTLQFMHATRRWENEPELAWTVDDLDIDQIRRTAEEAVQRNRLKEPDTREPLALLRGFGLTSGDVLLRAAVVLFGNKDRLAAEYTQCSVRAARFLGTDKSESSDNRQFHGNAIELLAKSQEFVREHLRIASRFEPDSFSRIDEPDYPPLAVREALTNAICHRDYSSAGGAVHVAMYDDRLEIMSPGTLPADFTPESLYGPHRSEPWNPLVADVFFRRGIIEKWGRGTLEMVKLAVAAGLPRPEIEDAHGSVTVRFRPNGHIPRYVHVKLSERHRQILALLSEMGPLPLPDIVHEMRKKSRSPQPMTLEKEKKKLQGELHELRAYRLVDCWGYGPGAHWEYT